jgi:hypothetical protein
MKEEKEPQEEPVEPIDESMPKAAPKANSNKFTVTDQGEHGYDNDGPFGIGMIKGVK